LGFAADEARDAEAMLGHRGAPPTGEVILGVRPESFPAARENAGNRIAAGKERTGRNF
jgi:hypothetical protein